MGAARTDEIVTLAHLARLSLDAEETARFGEQLGEILGYVEQLAVVDVEGVEEYLSPEQPGSKLRTDEVGPMLTPERALSSTQHRRAGMVVVPKFKED